MLPGARTQYEPQENFQIFCKNFWLHPGAR